MDNYERAKVVLTEHKTVLLRIADELLAREVLDADQIKRLAQGQSLPEMVPVSVAPGAPPSDGEPRRETHERPPMVPALGKPVVQE
jgi:hypothetical protein